MQSSTCYSLEQTCFVSCVCTSIEVQYPDMIRKFVARFRRTGVHRSLGTHVSKVRSLGLDALDETDLSVLRKVGNARSNAIWEHSLAVRTFDIIR